MASKIMTKHQRDLRSVRHLMMKMKNTYTIYELRLYPGLYDLYNTLVQWESEDGNAAAMGRMVHIDYLIKEYLS